MALTPEELKAFMAARDLTVFSLVPTARVILKPWGKEVIVAEQPGYAAKLLCVNAHCRLSEQIHMSEVRDEIVEPPKDETMILISGEAILWLEDSSGDLVPVIMQPFEGYHVAPGQIHRLQAVTDAVVFEASTPETGWTERLNDDHGRPPESSDMRKEPNRGWNPDN